MKNILANFPGENILFYTENLTREELSLFIEKVCKETPIDIYEVPDDELQYYIIDDRIWVDTPELENRLRKIIAN